METQVRTPQLIFMQPQRLAVPLFQRPYVWNQENQWEPLWNDVVRVADRLVARPTDKQNPHFLGAVVLQQVPRPTGLMQQRTIIDGQQRLTTLQLMLDAMHGELLSAGATAPAMRLESLVTNAEHFCARPEDRFKVWPTNRDRGAFNAVMAAPPPVDHDAVGYRGERMVEAHRFFTVQARQWLAVHANGDLPARAAALETTVRDLLQLVVIDLAADENAQEIFETLNARGAQLTAADLIKNFVFQRLLESGADVEDAYQRNWKDFETGFWEAEVSVGRLRYARSSIFLNHWLIAQTGEEVVAREVFARFKTFADFDSNLSMPQLLLQVHRSASVYRDFVSNAATLTGPIDRLGLFGYRTGVLESEVIKPAVVWLLDSEKPAIPDDQIAKALASIESWMVRRMLVRATTKGYNQVVAELIRALRGVQRDQSGTVVEQFLVGQRSDSRYWPDDAELRQELSTLLAYRRLGRGRLRMVLEAIEDYKRGWINGRKGLGGERVARGQYAIEHIMPRKWAAHWPLTDGTTDEARDRLIHTIGNLTLLTDRLNSKVSNGAWLGSDGKRKGLERHDVLLLNRELLKTAADEWTDRAIQARTEDLTKAILEIWPVPLGHRSPVSHEKHQPRRKKVRVADLLAAGWLQPGMTLFPRSKRFAQRVATLLPDGRLDVEGVVYEGPSAAASATVGHHRNGWAFFLTDQGSRRSLRTVRREYVETLLGEADEEEIDDEAEDDGQ